MSSREIGRGTQVCIFMPNLSPKGLLPPGGLLTPSRRVGGGLPQGGFFLSVFKYIRVLTQSMHPALHYPVNPPQTRAACHYNTSFFKVITQFKEPIPPKTPRNTHTTNKLHTPFLASFSSSFRFHFHFVAFTGVSVY
jgi:hypothetical protein